MGLTSRLIPQYNEKMFHRNYFTCVGFNLCHKGNLVNQKLKKHFHTKHFKALPHKSYLKINTVRTCFLGYRKFVSFCRGYLSEDCIPNLQILDELVLSLLLSRKARKKSIKNHLTLLLRFRVSACKFTKVSCFVTTIYIYVNFDALSFLA